MLSTTGNTAIYLQFAHARLASILRKAEEEKNVDLAALKALSETVVVAHDAERGLAFELLMFSDVVQVSCTTIATSEDRFLQSFILLCWRAVPLAC